MTDLRGPVVVGALGGSGTRVVARILIESGVHLGPDLNPQLDNLWFTLLFVRPRWYADVLARSSAVGEIALGLGVLEKAMLARPRLSPDERAFVRRAARSISFRGHDHRGAGRGIWPIVRALRLRAGATPAPESIAWGWKEPNAHVFLPYLIERFAGLRFIYVARHGLDMAYSPNRAQLYNWGTKYGVARPSTEAAVPAAMLAYWVAATRRAREIGAKLGGRFLFLDFDRLCREPRDQVPRLVEFAGARLDDERLARLVALPRVPPSTGRHRREPWRELDADHVAAVRELGFPIE